MIAQGILPFKYKEEKKYTGMTAMAGLPVYLDLMHASGFSEMIKRNLKVLEGGQGWTDIEIIVTLILLNLAGGDCVDDVRILEGDNGFGEVFKKVITYGMKRKERREWERRWRKEKKRGFPSPSAIFRYLGKFHSEEEEKRRKPHKAFIPEANENLKGLGLINREFIGRVQQKSRQKVATLDMDATVVETHKNSALYCYKGYRSYQPINIYWCEQDQILYSEYRNGNVPAGYEQLLQFK